MKTKTLKIPEQLFRSATIRAEGEGEKKTLRMSISSDEPCKRYDWMADEEYYEVLDHGPGGCDDARLKAGLPILFNHDRDQHLARAKSYANDGHKIEVSDLIWSESDFAKAKRADAESGALPDTSVGYRIIDDGECIGAKDGIPIYKFKWQILEASLVTIPADITVGVGRQRADEAGKAFIEIAVRMKEKIDETNELNHTRHQETTPPMKTLPGVRSHFHAADQGGATGGDGGTAAQIDIKAERASALSEFKARCKKIDEFVAAIKKESWRATATIIAAKHKDGEAIFDDFRAEFLNSCSGETQAVDTAHDVQVIGERAQDPRNRKTLGESFVMAKGFREFASGDRGSRRSFGIDVNYGILGARGKANLQQRAGWTSSDLSAVNVQIQQGMLGLGIERLTIMDLLSAGTISAAALIYPRENSFGTLDGVAFDAVGTGIMPKAGMVGEGGLKPEWLPDLTTETAAVKKVAVTTKVPDEFLADFPATQSYINERMPYLVDTRTEEQILYGDGTGNNLKGITTNAGLQTRAITTTDDSTIAASLKKGLTDISVGSFFEPTGFAFHPYDWETACLLKDDDKRFLAGGPFYVPLTNGMFVELRTFWGKPVVVTTAVKYGRPLAGAWKLGAQYFMREGMRLEMTNANEDDFRRNLMCIRTEHRLTLATYRPSAFLEFTGFPERA